MAKKFSLKGRTVVLTGAAGILGQEFARGLAQAGATLALVDVRPELNAMVDDIGNRYGVPTKAYVVDLREPQSVAELVAEIISDFGRIHVLHNNAAGKSRSVEDFLQPFETYSLRTWQEIMSINLDTVFLMAQAVGCHMVEVGGGSIIQTSSIYGILAPDKRTYRGSEYQGMPISSPAVYSASKAAIVGLTRYLAAYWGDKNVRVNTLTPGGVDSGQNEQFKANYSDRVPMGRMAEPNDMVGALIYLASDASKYVTGQNIVIDGGLSAW